jgi:hypothetical protein
MTVDEGRSLAGQKHGGPNQLLDISPTGGGYPLFEPARELRIIDQRLTAILRPPMPPASLISLAAS